MPAEFRGFPAFFFSSNRLSTRTSKNGISRNSYLASEDAFFYVLIAEYLYRSIALEAGEEKPVDLPTHIRITNVSFGEDLADTAARSVVKLTYSLPNTPDEDEDEEDEDTTPRITTVLCALTPGKVTQLFCCQRRNICVTYSTLLG